ncbi:MAG TPA: hypothetical protein VK489_02630 [Ferruginibacter sp.]|nr:hypothetical protein [Ferruginibacter sp.]
MKIKLIQSGGIAGKKMSASANHKFTKEQWDDLIAVSKKAASSTRSIKDGFNYVLENEEDENSKTAIDIQAIPEKYDKLFKKLFDKLK